MSFLAPLYFLGAMAVLGPLLFHLIRRTPKGEVSFSSLMFLSPTPPRLTRRSRLDNLLLLLLRAAALCLIAAAFVRPFWRQSAQLDDNASERRRTVLLIDTSASMRRADLWKKAKTAASALIADARPGDELAILSFDATSHPILGFEDSMRLDPTRRAAIAEARLNELTPSWGSTDLGHALVDAVGAIEDVVDKGEKAGRMPRRVVLISDLPQGAKLDALGEFAWPSDVDLELKTVATEGANAGLSVLADTTDADAPGKTKEADHKVRVGNDSTSRRESFELVWLDAKGVEIGKPVEVYVPPGESRVVRVPRQVAGSAASSLSLRGDVHSYDNTLYFADQTREEATVVFLGSDLPDDPNGLLYYLLRVFQDTPKRTVQVAATLPNSKLVIRPDRSTPLVIVAGETTPENIKTLEAYLKEGGTVLDVITTPGALSTLGSLAGLSPVDALEASVKRDAMLGAITFEHPLFAPLAGAGFNDFTKIRFWKYRKLNLKSLGDAHPIARFENGDPAVLETLVGKGRLVIFTSGWQPLDSQLARSSKFVPLMTALLEARDPLRFESVNVNVFDRVPLPPGDPKFPRTLKKPSGASGTIKQDSLPSTETDEPGVYTIDAPTGTKPIVFAVNLDPSESKVAPLAVETLEQFGCKLANPSRKKVDAEERRQMHNGELESRQKLWRWLILAAIAVLIVETWLAGRLSRPSPARAEALAT